MLVPFPTPDQKDYVLTGSGKWGTTSKNLAPVTLSGKNTVEFINISPAAAAITVMFKDVNIPSGNPDFVVQVGYGTTPTYMAGGYTGSTITIYQSQTIVTPYQNGFGIWSSVSPRTANVTSFTGVMRIALFDPDTNMWIASLSGSIVLNNAPYVITSSSYIALLSPLTAVRVTAFTNNPAVTFGGGAINVLYTI